LIETEKTSIAGSTQLSCAIRTCYALIFIKLYAMPNLSKNYT